MKNKKRIASYIAAGAIVLIPTVSYVFALASAPTRLQLAEKNYNQRVDAELLSITQRVDAECDYVDIKLAEHKELNLDGKEIERLSKKKQTLCEGN